MRRRAPLPPSTQRRVFNIQDEFPPSDPSGRLSPRGSYLGSAFGAAAFPGGASSPDEAGGGQEEASDLDGALPVLREPPSRCLRPVAEKRSPALAPRGPGARRHRLASRCQRSLDLPARSPLAAEPAARRACPVSSWGSAPARAHTRAPPGARSALRVLPAAEPRTIWSTPSAKGK